MRERQDMDEQDTKRRVLKYHEERVSRMLTWVGIEEERSVYLSDYNNIVRDLADPSLDDWALVRAAMLHIAFSEDLQLEHNRWLGQEIFESFKETEHQLYWLTLDTRGDRPVHRSDPQELYFNHQMADREATYYYSRTALAVLVSRDDPDRAIGLFEDLNSIFVPRIRFHLPGGRYSLLLERELDRLPLLYERVGRFEDALNLTPISFDRPWRDISPCDVAISRLEGWLAQLSESGGVSAVERFLDTIYEWLGSAGDVDEEERDHIGDCPTATRQFWAWYYGNALGRLLVARTSLRESLLDEIDAGEWENCWHIAGVLFETPPGSWDEYRRWALRFYNSADIEYRREGPIPWNAAQPPHLSAQSDLYWAMRIGFADAHADNAGGRSVSLAGIADSLERIEAMASSTAQHVLRTERNTDNLVEDVHNRVMPSDEYWHGLLRERLPTLLKILPLPTVEHLIAALRHKFAKEWDDCGICICKAVESLFHQIIEPKILELPESKEMKLTVPRPRNSPRRYSRGNWNRIQLSGWAKIIETATEKGKNAPLWSALPRAYPNVDLDAVVNLNFELAKIAQLRGSSAHDSTTSDERRANNAQELWDLVVGSGGEGFLVRFYSALGLTGRDQGSGNADGSG